MDTKVTSSDPTRNFNLGIDAVNASSSSEARASFNGTVEFHSAVPRVPLLRPSSQEELIRLLKAQHAILPLRSIRVIAGLCSFGYPQMAVLLNPSSDTMMVSADIVIDITGLDSIIEIDESRMVVTAEAGITYTRLVQALAERGLALENLSAYTTATLAGAAATSTHGSGSRILSDQFVRMTVADAAGNIHQIEDPRLFTHLGLLGIITRVTLTCKPLYWVKQSVYQMARWSTFREHLEATVQREDLFGVMARLELGAEDPAGLIYLRKVAEGPDDCDHDERFLGGPLVREAVERSYGGIHSVERTTFTDVYYDVIVDHSTISKASELPKGQYHQAEYFVPLACGGQAVDAVLFAAASEAPRFCRILPSGIKLRFIRSDSQLMSVCAAPDGETHWFLAFQLSLYGSRREVDEVLARIEAALAPFRPRTHWGKLSVAGVDTLNAWYASRLAEMERARRLIDPNNVFWDTKSPLFKLLAGNEQG